MAGPGKRLLYAATVFWSALLLLLLQPILTKAILPWFGGSAGVWVASMLFFQCVLLLGYVYAHVIARRLPLGVQAVAHAALLLVSLLWMPVSLSPSWKPVTGADPFWRILGLLATTAGLPYFLLSTTSPLIQSWFARTMRTEAPFRLFALSNLGSLVSLLSYPVVVEPLFSTRTQLVGWSVGYGLFVMLGVLSALVSRSGDPLPEMRLAFGARGLTWLGLAMCASVLWLAVANHLSQDVAAVPFLWILPLGLYLISFVLTFDSSRWYRPRLFRYLLPLAWGAITFGVSQQGYISIKLTIVMFAAALFLLCMFCHGELARLRPDSTELTGFYLTIAAGGALGGIFVGWVAPRAFDSFLELPIAVLGSVLLALWLVYGLPSKRVLRVGGAAAAATFVAAMLPDQSGRHQVRLRNFYGTLQVVDMGAADVAYRSLFNGTIQHGLEFISPDKARMATTYYGPASGVAIVLNGLRSGSMRLGVIGLGVGTMAAYGQPGDVFRFYEINPEVIRLSNVEFRYLSQSAAKVEIVPGDARLSLEREAPQGFDLLVVDAFSGDSIPVHLLTREAFALYWRHLRPKGALAIHVTNKHLDLAPVVRKLADVSGAKSALIINSKEDSRKIYASSWVIVTRNSGLAKFVEGLASPVRKDSAVWSDDYSNLLSLLQ